MQLHDVTGGRQPLKAVILAAGQETITEDGVPILLQPLGDLCVIDHVVQNALQVVKPEDLTLIVPEKESQVENHLSRPDLTYVVQAKPQGPPASPPSGRLMAV